MNEESYQKAVAVGMRVVYRLIMTHYRSIDFHNMRVFNPNTFGINTRKMKVITDVCSPDFLLAKMTDDGYFTVTKSRDYCYTLLRITDKFCVECKKQTGLSIDVPEIKQKRNFLPKKDREQKKNIRDKITTDGKLQTTDKDGKELELDEFGILALRKEIKNKIEKGDAVIVRRKPFSLKKLNLSKDLLED